MMADMERDASQKIKKLPALALIAKKFRKNGKKIIHCHGVFDLLHPGHIRYLTEAKKNGDILIVTITGDAFVKKGPGRPVFTEALRAEVLAGLSVVDYVSIIYDVSAIFAIRAIQPHFYVKGPDMKDRKLPAGIPSRLGAEEDAVRKAGGTLLYTDGPIFSSSHLLNEFFTQYPPETKMYLDQFRKKYATDQILADLGSMRNKKILVIGDAIVDQYHYTSPMGKSTKEPITVHKYIKDESYAGGTLATANHVASLVDSLTLVTVLGQKRTQEPFIRKHLKKCIIPKFFYRRDGSTIVKRRYIDEYTSQKLFQVSYITDKDIHTSVENKILTYLRQNAAEFDIVIVNDYGHGLLTPKLIRLITRKAKFIGINVQANSANFGFNLITKYPRADFVCVDDIELRLATHDRHGELKSLIKKIYKALHCREILVTRGPFGSTSYAQGSGFLDTPAFTSSIVDRVGAGDALFSIAATAYGAGLPRDMVAFLGNVAAALKIQTIGNKESIDFKEMTKFITRLLK